MKKTIVIGVTGGIAAYKSVQLTSDLIKKGYDVEVIMSKNATEFIAPLTFESLTKHNVMVSTFEKVADRSVKHISIAKRADLFVLVPATANAIAKIAHGLADDMLTTTFLACTCTKIICPAMNTNMYENAITQNNIKLCKEYGMRFIEPADGYLACGDSGKGKLADLDVIMQTIESMLQKEKILTGKKVLITAGPTQEPMDPVRFITNHSSGKMGYELAKAAQALGAQVTLISGPVKINRPEGLNIIDVMTAQDMMDAVLSTWNNQDIIIKAAAVSDYRIDHVEADKIKKDDEIMNIQLIKNPDILAYLGDHKHAGQVLCGFAMETRDLIENAQQKLHKKHCDMLVANNLKESGAGFQGDTNIVTLFKEDGYETLDKMSKAEVSYVILEKLYDIYKEKEEQPSC